MIDSHAHIGEEVFDEGFGKWFYASVVGPFVDFFRRYGTFALTMLAFVGAAARWQQPDGQAFVVFIMVVAAAEVEQEDWRPRLTAVGSLVATRAKAAGVDKVKFDRGPYKYHGRVKELAQAAREGGLVF